MPSEEVLRQLTIHNLPSSRQILQTFPEYQRTAEGKSSFFSIVPEDVARCSMVDVFPTNESSGIFGIHSRLIHALDAQLSKFYACWILEAHTVEVLQASLYELCDALDPSGNVAEAAPCDVFPVLRTYFEQQRIRSRCGVLVLDHATNATVQMFLTECCSSWGLRVLILPSEPLELDPIREFLPHVQLHSCPPLRCADKNLFEPTPDVILRERFRVQFLPFLFDTVLGNPAYGERLEYDESYLMKYAVATNGKTLLMRMAVWRMHQDDWDTYTLFNAWKARRGSVTDTVTQQWDAIRSRYTPSWSLCGISVEEVLDFAAILHLIFDTSRVQQDAGLQTEVLSCGFLPCVFPTHLLTTAALRLLVDIGLCTVVEGGGRTGSFVSMCRWVQLSLQCMASSPQRVVGHLFDVIMALDASTPPPDVVYFSMHDAMSLAPKRVSGNSRISAAHADAQQHIASTPGTVLHDVTGVMEADDTRTLQWHRWRAPVVTQLMALVASQHWYYQDVPYRTPPIQRPFTSDLSFGLPPLPDDDSSWTPQLGNLFRLYAAHYLEEGDSLNAAAALERSLCVLLYFFDVAASSATARFAAALTPQVHRENSSANNAAASVFRRRSTMRHRDSMSRPRSRSNAGDDDLRSVASGLSQSLVRKMSRVSIMTQESAMAEGDESSRDDVAYSHIVALLMLRIEDQYRRIAACYHQGQVVGVAVPLLDRSITALDLLNGERRDTPARSMSHYRRAQRSMALSEAETRRARVLQEAEVLKGDEGGMRLRALVRASVDERHHLRDAHGEMTECLAVLKGSESSVAYYGDVLSDCHAVAAKHFLSEVDDRQAATHAEEALSYLLATKRRTPIITRPLGEPVGQFEEVSWCFRVASAFLASLETRQYHVAHTMLDRSPLLCCIGVAAWPEGRARSSLPSVGVKGLSADRIIMAECGTSTRVVLDQCYPEPTLQPHLGLYTSFSDLQVAAHHGNDWQKTAVPYRLPLLMLLQHRDMSNLESSMDAMTLFKRLLLTLQVNPLSCSPHNMKTALHIAVETSQHDVVEALLQHPQVDPLFAAEKTLSSSRQGLSTLPCVTTAPNPTQPPLYFCPVSDSRMLMVLLLGAHDPHFLFRAARTMIVERFAADERGEQLLGHILGEGGVFHASLKELLLSKELCSETREMLSRLCPRPLAEWGLEHLTDDPHVVLQLARLAAQWGAEGTALLQRLTVSFVDSKPHIAHLLITQMPPELRLLDSLPFDVVRVYRKYTSQLPNGGE